MRQNDLAPANADANHTQSSLLICDVSSADQVAFNFKSVKNYL